MKYIGRKRLWIYKMLLLCTALFTGCNMRSSQKITYVDTAMGTIVQQTLYVKANSKQAKDCEKIPDEVMDLLNSLEKETLSWREETSEIHRINTAENGTGCILSREMLLYLESIRDVWENSDGALDVTVGGVTGLWNIDTYAVNGNADFDLPAQQELESALASTGFEKVKIVDSKIYLPENIKLDLGAVGKGIACDEVHKVLAEKEWVTGAVISIGGSVLTYGEKPDGSKFKVAVTHPRKEGESIAVLELEGGLCVSTSGDYERYVEKDGVRYHHIMDPKTGYPADSGLISVTIVSESGLLSDALSTACFILGKEAGLILAEQCGAEALLIDKDLQFSMTEGMDKLLIMR